MLTMIFKQKLLGTILGYEKYPLITISISKEIMLLNFKIYPLKYVVNCNYKIKCL